LQVVREVFVNLIYQQPFSPPIVHHVVHVGRGWVSRGVVESVHAVVVVMSVANPMTYMVRVKPHCKFIAGGG
jgi:hypothetical protein